MRHRSEAGRPETGRPAPQTEGRSFWPRSTIGWSAVALALIALASWVVFPILSMTYRTRYPVVDTWVMPAVATILVDAAAVLSLVTVWLRRERSVANLVTLVITLLAALFFTFMVVGEGIAGV